MENGEIRRTEKDGAARCILVKWTDLLQGRERKHGGKFTRAVQNYRRKIHFVHHTKTKLENINEICHLEGKIHF